MLLHVHETMVYDVPCSVTYVWLHFVLRSICRVSLVVSWISSFSLVVMRQTS